MSDETPLIDWGDSKGNYTGNNYARYIRKTNFVENELLPFYSAGCAYHEYENGGDYIVTIVSKNQLSPVHAYELGPAPMNHDDPGYATCGIFDNTAENQSKILCSAYFENVMAIAHDAFKSCTNLISVTMPNSLIVIDFGVFRDCVNLANVTIPDNVRIISGQVFYGCVSLKSIIIPDSVIKIGNIIAANGETFAGCSGLKNVILSSSITYIPEGLFYGCTSLTNVTIPEGVAKMGNYFYNKGAFENCTSLTSITLPSSLISIARSTFRNCIRLSDIYYGGTEEQWNAIEISNYNDPLLNATIHYNSTGPDDVHDD